MKKNNKAKLILVIFLFIILLLGIFLFLGYDKDFNIRYSAIGINKYNFDDLPDNFNLIVGKEFNLDVDIDNENSYTYSDDGDLFEIDKNTGKISFIPNTPGEFGITIIALQDVDNFHFKFIKFRVIES